jgi:hypothetical protein
MPKITRIELDEVPGTYWEGVLECEFIHDLWVECHSLPPYDERGSGRTEEEAYANLLDNFTCVLYACLITLTPFRGLHRGSDPMVNS